VTGGWKRLHNEELHNLYAFENKVLKEKIWTYRGESDRGLEKTA
jgi:hypothetical protein